MKFYLSLFFLIFISCGTESDDASLISEDNLENQKSNSDSASSQNMPEYMSAAPNASDANGLKQGHWCIYGNDDHSRNYPLEAKIEEGSYKDDKKVGDWFYYSREGAVDSIISYRGNIPKHSTSAINKVDANGVKNGYWIFYGKDLPEKNYAEESKVEEGMFKDGIKDGRWIYFGKDGKVDSSVIYEGDSISSVYDYQEKRK